jgi:hypothetical protein
MVDPNPIRSFTDLQASGLKPAKEPVTPPPPGQPPPPQPIPCDDPFEPETPEPTIITSPWASIITEA